MPGRKKAAGSRARAGKPATGFGVGPPPGSRARAGAKGRAKAVGAASAKAGEKRTARSTAQSSLKPSAGSAVRLGPALTTEPVADRGAKPGPKPASRLSTLEDVYVPTRRAWRRWLTRNHDRSPGVWLVFDRKSSRPDRLAYGDSVEEALCFGWIDSTVRQVDAARYKQLFTPRKPKSTWSRTNKERVERLIAGGLMT